MAEGLSAADRALVTAVTDQIGQQIENIRLLAETDQYRAEAEAAVRRLAGEGWLEAQETMAVRGFEYDQKRVRPIDEPASVEKPYHAAPYLAPLEIQGEPIGMLEIDQFGIAQEDGQRIAESVLKQLTAHLENLRLTQQTARALAESQERSAELALVNRIVSRVAGSLDLREAMQIVVDELVNILVVDQARIALLEEGGQHLMIIAEHYDAEITQSAVGIRLPLEGNDLTRRVLETRQTVMLRDVQNNPLTAPAHSLFRAQGIETVLIMPMAVGAEVIGTVGIDILQTGRELTAEQLRLAETIIFQAATAVQNARLFAQTQDALAEAERRAVELQRVAEISTAVTQTLDVQELLQNVVDLTRDRFGLYHAHIYLLDPKQTTLQLVAGAGDVGRVMVAEELQIR